MGKVQALRSSEPPRRSPQREQLAAAIERHVAAQREVAAIIEAERNAWRATMDAERAVETAKANVEAVKSAAAEHIGEALLRQETPTPPATREARVALGEAEDLLAATEEARAALPQKRTTAEAGMRSARSALDARLKDVIRSELDVGKLLDAAEAAQAELLAQRIVLRHLWRSHLVAETDSEAVARFLRRNMLPGGAGAVEFEEWNDHPASEPLRAALTALESDPDAPLPAAGS